MSGSIKTKEDALFVKYKNISHVADGVFEEKTYTETSPKIVFILKEPVGDSAKTFRLGKVVGDGSIHTTWTNIARWAQALHLQSENKTVCWPDIEKTGKDVRKKWPKKIVAINLKKIAGPSGSNMRAIYDHVFNVEGSAELLRRQISIYNPDYVVCCGNGVADIVRKVLYGDESEVAIKWKSTSRNVWYFLTKKGSPYQHRVPIIAFYHPQNRIKHHLMAFSLLDAIKHINNAANN